MVLLSYIQTEASLTDKLVDFFKKAQAGQIKTDLEEDEVKEVLPDLPQAGAKNFVSYFCHQEIISLRLTSAL